MSTMMEPGARILSSYGFDIRSELHVIDEDRYLHITGNLIKVAGIRGDQRFFGLQQCPLLGQTAVHVRSQVLACAEKAPNPRILLHHLQDHSVLRVLESTTPVAYSMLSFSRDGRYLAALGSLPDFAVTLFDVSNGAVICTESCGFHASSVSVNPRDPFLLSCSGPAGISFWIVESATNAVSSAGADDEHDRSPQIFSEGEGPQFRVRQRMGVFTSRYAANMSSMNNNGGGLDSTISAPSGFGNSGKPVGAPVDILCHAWGVRNDIYCALSTGELIHFEDVSESPTGRCIFEAGSEHGSIRSILVSRRHIILGTDSGRVLFVSLVDHALCGEVWVDPMMMEGSGSMHSTIWADDGNFGGNRSAAGGSRHGALGSSAGHGVSEAVIQLSFTPSFSRVYFVTSTGRLGHFPIVHTGADSVSVESMPVSIVGDYHVGPVTGLLCVPRSQRAAAFLMSCGYDGSIRCWEFLQNKLTIKFTFDYTVHFRCAVLSPSGRVAAFGDDSGVVYVFNVEEGHDPQLIFCERISNEFVDNLCFTSDSKSMILHAGQQMHFFTIQGLSTVRYIGYSLWPMMINAVACPTQPSLNSKYSFAYASTDRGDLFYFHVPSEPLGGRTPSPAVDPVAGKSGSAAVNPPRTSPTGVPPSENENHGSAEPISASELLIPVEHLVHLHWKVDVSATAITAANEEKLFVATETRGLHRVIADMDRLLQQQLGEDMFIRADFVDPELFQHDKVSRIVFLSADGTMLASAGCDGRLFCLQIDNQTPMDSEAYIRHDPTVGGISAATFNVEHSHVFTAGFDGQIFVTSIIDIGGLQRHPSVQKLGHVQPFTGPMQTVCIRMPVIPVSSILAALPASLAASTTVQTAASGSVSAGPQAAVGSAASANPNVPPIDTNEIADGAILPFYSYKIRQREIERSQREFEEAKTGIISELGDLQVELNSLLIENEKASDLEQLNTDEFMIDTELRGMLEVETEREVNQLRENVVRENLSKELLSHRIQRECWESMEVPNVVIQPFQRGDPVSNFALRKRSQRERSLVDKVRLLRVVEIKLRRALRDDGSRVTEALVDPACLNGTIVNAAALLNAAGKVTVTATGNAPAAESGAAPGSTAMVGISGPAPSSSAIAGDGAGSGGALGVGSSSAALSTVGGDTGGGGEDLSSTAIMHSDPLDSIDVLSAPVHAILYRPFDTFSGYRKITQAVLLSRHTLDIQREFNSRFQNALDQKSSLLAKVRDKMSRMKEIFVDLKIEEPLVEPQLADDEVPDRILSVQDSEITSEKYVAPEEIARREQERLDRERLAQQGESGYMRALMDMMNGRLEKPDENPLDREPVCPDWMAAKAKDEMTPDELNELKKFEKRLQEFREEREKHRKQLETELKKIRKDIEDLYRAFDESLGTLLSQRLQAAQMLYETEFCMIKLAQALDEERRLRRKLVAADVQYRDAVQQRALLDASVMSIRHSLSTDELEYEQCVQDDKAMDRGFRQRFAEADQNVDHLLRLFRRRPKAPVPGMGGMGLGGNGILGGGGLGLGGSSGLGDLSSRSSSGAGGDAQRLDPFSDLDAREEMAARTDVADSAEWMSVESERPEDLNDDLWESFLDFRREKIQLENDIRRRAEQLDHRRQTLGRMEQLLTELDEEVHKRAKVVESLQHQIRLAAYDLDVLVKMKQGQVEVEQAAVITDYADSMLIPRGIVEDLNVVIRQHGEEKVQILEEIKDFRKEIHKLAWENDRLDVLASELVLKTREYQLLRVTKAMQEIIKNGGSGQKESERLKIEKRTEHLMKNFEKKVEEKKSILDGIAKRIEEKQLENDELEAQIDDIKDAVDDRNTIRDMQAGSSAERNVQRKMRTLRMNRKLKDLADAQVSEITFLKQELERLRERTFPSFAVVQTRSQGHPDERYV